MRREGASVMAKIIVIDDEGAIRSTVRRILERVGHQVWEAEDGKAGLGLIGREAPDLVITDLLMPEKEGIETIQELRATDSDLPIVAISGAGSAEEGGPLLDAELFGANATLPKPFSASDLQETVDRVLADTGRG